MIRNALEFESEWRVFRLSGFGFGSFRLRRMAVGWKPLKDLLGSVNDRNAIHHRTKSRMFPPFLPEPLMHESGLAGPEALLSVH